MLDLVPCFGTYDKGDETCCGNSKTGEEACALKKYCSVFTRYLIRLDKPVSEFIECKYKGDEIVEVIPKDGKEKFWTFVQNLSRSTKPKSKRKKRRKTRCDKIPGQHKPPSKKNKIASRESRKAIKYENQAKLLGIFNEFKRVLIIHLANKRKFTEIGEPITPGNFYVKNKMDTSRYLSVFCRMNKGHDFHVVRLATKPRRLQFDVLLPVTNEELERRMSLKIKDKLSPLNEINISKLKTEVKGLDIEGLVIIAEIIAKMINDGIIDLPSV
jgi:hypothetical protein